MKTHTGRTVVTTSRRFHFGWQGTCWNRTLLRVALAFALLACTQLAHANLVAVLVNGVPYGPNQPISVPRGLHPVFVKIPGQDLAYFVYTFVPPPPQTYRVVSPNGTITDFGDGSKGKPKQNGAFVVIEYKGDTFQMKGTLLMPGDPNPAPAPAREGTTNGPGNFLPPGVALADAKEFLQQPELADI